MSKIWRPKTSHKDGGLEQKPQDKKHAQKSHPTYPSGSESQAPDSAIVACSSTNIETCRSPSPHETDKTTHTCHATILVHDARIFNLILMPEIWHHTPQRRSGLGMAQRISCIWGQRGTRVFAELRRTTHTQDHKRVLSTWQRTDSLSSDSCPRFGMTSFSKDQALMFLLVQKHENKHKLQDLGRRTRRANCECNRFTDTVALRSDNNPTNIQTYGCFQMHTLANQHRN